MQPSINSSELSQQGSILIPVIAFVLLASVFISLGLDFLELRSPEEDRRRTIADINLISSEIASYAQKYNRIPCPADPAVTSNNPLFGTEAKSASNTSCTRREGLVPVRALNLPDKYMLDSWSRYYTYAISPVYADTDTAETQIHQNCRIRDIWVFTHTFSGNAVININPPKARFCCPSTTGYDPSTDLILSSNGALVYNPRDSSGGHYADVNTPETSANGSIESPAIAIISHGPNGVNAFLSNGSGARGTGSFTTAEVENADGDTQFEKNMTNTSPADYFDDIVIFKSQFELMAALNDGTCTQPFFSYNPDMLKPKGFEEPIN